MPDILLNYADQDRETARRIGRLLEAQGWSVRWEGAPADGAAARCMVVLWSRHSVNSDEVAGQAEQGRADHALVPVLLEKVTPPPGLRSIQAADLSGWDGAADAPGARQLVADLAELLGQPLPSGRVIRVRSPWLAP